VPERAAPLREAGNSEELPLMLACAVALVVVLRMYGRCGVCNGVSEPSSTGRGELSSSPLGQNLGSYL
jgi:hypothetical protein